MASPETEAVVKLAHDLPDDESTVEGDENGNRSASGGNTVRKTTDIKIYEKVGFDTFMLKEVILKGLKRAGYIRPSPIQLKAVPVGRIGVDMIVQAKAGTGKTCVFTVLALETVESANPAPQVVILAPAREIAIQITDTLKGIGHYMLETKENVFTGVKSNQDGIKIETFIGGTALQIDKDKAKLQKCQIVVGTPGRVWQMVDENHLSLDAVRLFVLDEADKLMETSYQEQINSIYAHLPSGKQMVVTSATYPNELDEFLSRYMKTPKFVNLGDADVQLFGIKQYLLTSDSLESEESSQHGEKDFESWIDKKIDVVHRILSRVYFNQCLIFCTYQDKVEVLAKKLLAAYKWPAAFIASNLTQTQRTMVLRRLQNFQIRILVSTDLTARGIDAENVNLVINFDLPYNAETYFHRIGRAGRFGGYGAAITLACNRTEEMKFYAMAVENNFQVKKLPLITEIPNNLAENEQYYFALPQLDYPSEDQMNRFAARQERTGKGKPQQNRNGQKQASPKPLSAAAGGMDEYTKLISLAGPTERWSPVEFIWEENDASSSSAQMTPRPENGKRIQYSRMEMLNILKENLSSLPSPISSLGGCQSIENGEDGKRFEYSRTEMLDILKDISPASPSHASVVTVQSTERGISPAVTDRPVKGQRIDVSALFGYFQGDSESKASNNSPVNVTNEQTGKQIVSPPKKTYNREEMMEIRPLCNRAVAEQVFIMEDLDYTFIKKKKRSRKAETKAPTVMSYSREEMLSVQSLCNQACAEETFEMAKLDDTFDGKKRKPIKGESGPKPLLAQVKVKPCPVEEKPKLVKKPKTDIRKQYDEAITSASKSPFYEFFGRCALTLQAAGVESRKGIGKMNKETQTEETCSTAAPPSPVRQPGRNPIAYNRDQMISIWNTVANTDWSFKRRQYPWIKVVKENGLLVDWHFGEVPIQNAGEDDGDEDEEEETEEDEGDVIGQLIAQQKKALEDYEETMKLYKKCLQKYKK